MGIDPVSAAASATGHTGGHLAANQAELQRYQLEPLDGFRCRQRTRRHAISFYRWRRPDRLIRFDIRYY